MAPADVVQWDYGTFASWSGKNGLRHRRNGTKHGVVKSNLRNRPRRFSVGSDTTAPQHGSVGSRHRLARAQAPREEARALHCNSERSPPRASTPSASSTPSTSRAVARLSTPRRSRLHSAHHSVLEPDCDLEPSKISTSAENISLAQIHFVLSSSGFHAVHLWSSPTLG